LKRKTLGLRSWASLETEILASRYQLTVLRRKAPESLAFGTSRYCVGPQIACRITHDTHTG